MLASFNRDSIFSSRREWRMNETTKSPFDKEPAEGSRETVDKQLEQQKRAGSRTPDRSDRQDQRNHPDK
jgi:hypothetical protein